MGSDDNASLLTKEIILGLRSYIAEYLEELEANEAELPPLQGASQSLVVTTLNEDLEELCQAIADLAMDTPEAIIQEAISGFADECVFMSETLELPWLAEALAPVEEILHSCDALEALLTIQELVVEIRQQRDTYLENHLAAAAEAEHEAVFRSEVEPGLDDYDETESEGGFFDFGEEESEAALTTVMFAPPAVSKDKMIAKVAEV
ncbi:MAG: hypothetical protein AAFO76_16120, partial [Cyanobacteria bacterium J06607_15]